MGDSQNHDYSSITGIRYCTLIRGEPRVDMNFIFECSTRVEHEKIKFIFTSGHVIFCLLYKHTNNDVLTIFRRFPSTFRRFPKLFCRLDERFRTFSEDCRRKPKIYEEGPMMFRSHRNTSEYFLRDYVAIAMAILSFVKTTFYFHA